MATTELPFDLIEAKLAPPVLRTDTVTKSELLDRLRGSGSSVVSLVAPAGFGKTTLVAHLAERDDRALATVSLDERDNDPVVLLRYVAVALSRVDRVPPSVFEALSTPGRSIWSTCIPRVCTALAGIARPMVLVLDDLHFVTDPTSLDAIAALLDHVPQQSLVLVSTREEPGLGLARLRAQGRVLEIGADDLRLNPGEAATLLRNAGVDLDDSAVSVLTDRTEGWPAGLYLAALSLRAGGAGADAARRFSGDDRFVADYMRLELLSQLTDDEVRFLTRTSVLDRMCGGLCDAVLARKDCAALLASLERSNRFLVPLDQSRTWYRYHHLFRDLLRSELEHREPELAPELQRRAMAWCEANGLLESALHYGHEAGDTYAVTRLFEQLLLPTYYTGGVATTLSWLDWYDQDGLRERHPTVAVFGAWLCFLTGSLAQGDRWARAAESSTALPELPDGSASIEPWIATLRAYMCPDGIERMLADAERALETLGPEGWWRPSAQLAAGVAHALLGDAERARPALGRAAELAAAAGGTDEESLAFAQLALLALEAGASERAAAHAARAVKLAEDARLDGYLACALAYAVAARVAVHRGDLVTAREYVAVIHRLRPQFNTGFPWLSVQAGLELARIHLALGEARVAGTVLSEAETILSVRPRLGTLAGLARELRQRIALASTPGGAWAMSLTAAELRVLPLLTTHLAFPQIGERLFLSRTTVKTHASSIYRKFGVSSRAEAIERAVELGLLEDSLYPARAVPVAST